MSKLRLSVATEKAVDADPIPERLLARVEVSHADVCLDEEGIVWQHLRGGTIELEAAMQIMVPTMALAARSPHNPKRMVTFATGIRRVTRDARLYFSQYEPDNPEWGFPWRTAVVVQNPIQRVIAQFFMGLNKLPSRTTAKVFSNFETALDWLRAG